MIRKKLMPANSPPKSTAGLAAPVAAAAKSRTVSWPISGRSSRNSAASNALSRSRGSVSRNAVEVPQAVDHSSRAAAGEKNAFGVPRCSSQ